MKKILSIPIVFFILTLAFTGCKKEDTVYYINSHPQELHFGSEGGTDTVAVTSNSAWTVDIPEVWCTTNLSSVSTSVKTVYLRFSVQKNTSGAARAQDVVIQSKSNSSIKSVITVFQAYESGPDDPDPPVTADTLTLSITDIEIPCRGGDYDFSLFSDTTWTYEGSNASWCNLAPAQEAGGRGVYPFTFIADMSKSTQTRTAVLAFKTVNDTIAFLHVTQRPLGISVPEDLIAFRDDVNDKKDLRPWMDSDSTVHLLANLDMSSVADWTPIGEHTYYLLFNERNSSFSGTFNGNNHAISNLNITGTTYRSTGLFGSVINAEIRDLILDQSCSVTVTPGDYQYMATGGICGTLAGGTVNNCHFRGSIKVSGNSTSASTGGIAGVMTTDLYHNPAVVSYSSNSGSVEGLYETGGIAGTQTTSVISYCENKAGAVVKGIESTGGICGYSGIDATIRNSQNRGTVQGTENMTGGICGDQYDGSLIKDCVNLADAFIKGASFTGGICGYSRVTCTIENCENKSDISGSDNLGGICGVQYLTCTIKNSSNNGDITSLGTEDEESAWTGGIAGGNINSDILDCDNAATVRGETAAGGIAGYFYGDNAYRVNGCSNTAHVEGLQSVGGICGSVSGALLTINQGNNSGTVTGNSSVGGIAGTLTDNASVEGSVNQATAAINALEGPAGGIAAMVDKSGSDIINCKNYAPVTSTWIAGGIAAYTKGVLKQCLNTGAITTPLSGVAEGSQDEEGITEGDIYDITVSGGIAGVSSSTVDGCENRGVVSGYSAGGVVARFTSGSTLYKVKNCINSGAVTGRKSAGGVVASNTSGGTMELNENSGLVTGSFFVGGIVAENLRGKLNECTNSGTITGTETEMDDTYFAIAGICAFNEAGNLTGCVNSGSVTRVSRTGKSKFVGGVVGVTGRGSYYSGGELKACSNSGPVSGYINTDLGMNCFVGGFCGFFVSGPAPVDCTNAGTVNGEPASDANMYGGTN
ncbi:MAG: BACON domain-containing protein [Bacteroidales bacterium]|jgi:hypothetical protein